MPANLAWDSLYLTGNCPPEYTQHFEPKPKEMLFDTKADPFCLNNLADDPKYAPQLIGFRKAVSIHIRETKDLGFFPKDVRDWFVENNLSLYTWAHENNYDFDLLYQVVEKASEKNMVDVAYFVRLLDHERPEIRFWAASGLAHLAGQGDLKEIPQKLYQRLWQEEFASVVAVMAETLVKAGDQKRGLQALVKQAKKHSGFAFSSLEELRDLAREILPDIQALAENSKNAGTRFSARSILINFGLLPLHKLYEQNRIESFLEGHRSRVERWAPTLP